MGDLLNTQESLVSLAQQTGGFAVLNPNDGRDKRKEGFSTPATLIRDGKAFHTTPPAPVGAAPQDAKPVGSVPVGGTLSLGSKLPRGTYRLQVSVAPKSGKGRNRPASQWVDFEVRS